MAGGSASALSLSNAAQASHTLRPVGSFSHPRWPLSGGPPVAGFGRSSATGPIDNIGGILHPLMIRAFPGRTAQNPTSSLKEERGLVGGRAENRRCRRQPAFEPYCNSEKNRPASFPIKISPVARKSLKQTAISCSLPPSRGRRPIGARNLGGPFTIPASRPRSRGFSCRLSTASFPPSKAYMQSTTSLPPPWLFTWCLSCVSGHF